MKKSKTISRKNAKKPIKARFGAGRRIAIASIAMHDDHGFTVVGKRDEPPVFSESWR